MLQKPLKNKASQILPDLSVYTRWCEAPWPLFFFCLFHPLDGCCRILESNSPVQLRLFCSFLHLKQFCTAGSRFRVSHSALRRQLQVATYIIRADWAFSLHRTQLQVKGQSRCFPLCMYFTTYKQAQQYPDLETTHTTEVKKINKKKTRMEKECRWTRLLQGTQTSRTASRFRHNYFQTKCTSLTKATKRSKN